MWERKRWERKSGMEMGKKKLVRSNQTRIFHDDWKNVIDRSIIFSSRLSRTSRSKKYRVFLLLLLSYYIDGRGETTLCAKKKSKMEEGRRENARLIPG